MANNLSPWLGTMSVLILKQNWLLVLWEKKKPDACIAMSSEFETWLSDRLVQFNADGEVFSSYILGILDSEESQEEKENNLSDLLEGTWPMSSLQI